MHYLELQEEWGASLEALEAPLNPPLGFMTIFIFSPTQLYFCSPITEGNGGDVVW